MSNDTTTNHKTIQPTKHISTDCHAVITAFSNMVDKLTIDTVEHYRSDIFHDVVRFANTLTAKVGTIEQMATIDLDPDWRMGFYYGIRDAGTHMVTIGNDHNGAREIVKQIDSAMGDTVWYNLNLTVNARHDNLTLECLPVLEPSAL